MLSATEQTMFSIIDDIRHRAVSVSKRIVYPNLAGARSLEAVARIAREGIARPVLVGDPAQIEAQLREIGGLGNIEVAGQDPLRVKAYADILLEELGPRGFREAEIREQLRDPTEYAAAMVRAGDAYGLVLGPPSAGGGASGKRSGLNRGRQLIFRCFLVVPAPEARRGGLLFGDRISVETPRAAELADLAVAAASLAGTLLQRRPRAAFLAPSVVAQLKRGNRFTSAAVQLERRVEEAITTLGAREPGLVVASGLERTLPSNGQASEDSPDTYVFADSQAGNLRGQLARAFNGARIVGPILRGFCCSVGQLLPDPTADDIIDLTAATAVS